jgi:hypothetical protein
MKIYSVGAEMLHVDRHTERERERQTDIDRQTDRERDRQRDRHDEADSRPSQFYESAKKQYA